MDLLFQLGDLLLQAPKELGLLLHMGLHLLPEHSQAIYLLVHHVNALSEALSELEGPGWGASWSTRDWSWGSSRDLSWDLTRDLVWDWSRD